MATRLQLRRGNHTQSAAFKGVAGELTLDTDRHDLRIHTGNNVTGGYNIPSIEGKATDGTYWWRVFSDGFIMQGFDYGWNGAWTTLTLPHAMPDANYSVVGTGYRTDGSPYQGFCCIKNITSTSFEAWFSDDTSSNPGYVRFLIIGGNGY